MTKEELKVLGGIVAGVTALATAITGWNQTTQDRLKADSKIYGTLAEASKQQAAEIVEVRKQVAELRGYLQATRDMPAAPAPAPVAPLLRPLSGLRQAPPSSVPTDLPELPPLPSAAPAPVLRKLPRFEDLAP